MVDFDKLHLFVFNATLVSLLLLEQFPALRRKDFSTLSRWGSNVGLMLINGVLARVLLPTSILAFAMAQPAQLLSNPQIPLAAQILIGFLFLDFAQYWTHRISHAVPLLWRAHLVHHSDTHIDVTTSQRHHPLEGVVGSALGFLWVYLLGIPAEAFGLYILAATFVAVFSHANLRFPESYDRWLRLLIVTPGVHAIHHSSVQAQTDSNFSIVLPVWDRWFGTYNDPSRASVVHTGLEYFHLPKDASLHRVLIQPFTYRAGMSYPDRIKPVQDLAKGSGAGQFDS